MKTYKYLRGSCLEDVESMDYYYSKEFPTRRGRWVFFDDYPEHRHGSKGYVQIMELIPIKRYENTKYLCESRDYFNTIELDDSEVFKFREHLYMVAFEREMNTTIWKLYTHQIDDGLGSRW